MSFDKSFEGIGEVTITCEKSGTVTAGTHEGKAASMPSSGAAKVGAADEKLLGVIRTINQEDIAVQVGGIMKASYTGSAPTAGAVNKLECGAAGVVQVDASNGDPFYVVKVDTTNSLVWFFRAL